MDTPEPVIHLDGREIPLDETDTGLFEVTTGELKRIILLQLLATKSKSRRQRILFDRVLKAMGIRCQRKKQEPLYKIYVDVLRELRDAGDIILQAGKDATCVKIPK